MGNESKLFLTKYGHPTIVHNDLIYKKTIEVDSESQKIWVIERFTLLAHAKNGGINTEE